MLLPVPRSRYPWKIRTRMAVGRLPHRERSPDLPPAHAVDREVIREVEPGKIYVDHESGEQFEIVGKIDPAGAVAEQPAVGRREPAPVRLLAGAAGAQGRERLPALRPAAAGRRGLSQRLPRFRSPSPAGCCWPPVQVRAAATTRSAPRRPPRSPPRRKRRPPRPRRRRRRPRRRPRRRRRRPPSLRRTPTRAAPPCRGPHPRMGRATICRPSPDRPPSASSASASRIPETCGD